MKRGGTDFDMVLTLDGAPIRVTGHITRYYPATGPTWDCGGQPTEGAEVEDFQAFAEDGSEIEDPDGKIQESLYDEIYDAVESAKYGPGPDAERESMLLGE